MPNHSTCAFFVAPEQEPKPAEGVSVVAASPLGQKEDAMIFKSLTDLHPMFSLDEGGAGAEASGQSAGGDILDQLDTLPDDRQVPVSVAKAIRRELQEAKSKFSQLEETSRMKDDQIFLLRTHLNSNGGQNAPQGSGKPVTGTFLDELEDDEPLTAGQAKQLLQMNAAQAAGQGALIEAQRDPDYQALITTHITNVLKARPNLIQRLASLPPSDRFLMAYELGKSDPEYHKAKSKTPDGKSGIPVDEKAKIIEGNLKKPGSPSSVQPSAASSSEADRLRTMSSADFRKYRNDRMKAARR